MLLKENCFEEAYAIYDEIYRQIWFALGSASSGLTEFTRGFLIHNIKSSIEFKNSFLEKAVNTTFVKLFNLDIDQTHNEFVFTLSGRLQCIILSQEMVDKTNAASVFTEFLLVYTLILHGGDERWVNSVLKVITPMVDQNGLKRMHTNITEEQVAKQLVSFAGKIKETDWYQLNMLILEYLGATGNRSSEVYRSISRIVGPYSNEFRSRWKKRSWEKQKEEAKQDYTQYEKYEKYERYEKYEKFKQQKSREDEFDPRTASEDQKARHYGKALGLRGRVTKNQIRKKYLESISKYHPDKVHNLGKELVDLAERKTKDINTAYLYFKEKYKL